MFGSCVLNRLILLLLLSLLFPVSVWAQAQKGTVIVEGALVYKDADFDAPLMTRLKIGSVYNISKKKKGPFFKIRLKPGSTGWISDTDIRPGVFKMSTPEKPKDIEAKERERKKPFFATRYRGPVLQLTSFTEDTLGKERTAALPFYGVKFSGFNTLFTGEIYAEANILFHFGAPSYYEVYTGNKADGFIFVSEFLLQTVIPQGRNVLIYYGFGPMFKYSHFDLEVDKSASTVSYPADDMGLGAVFDLGFAVRMGRFSVRTDAKYYWERSRYGALGLGLGWDF